MSKARDFLEELDPPELIELPESIQILPSLNLFKPLEQDIIELRVKGSSPADISLRLAIPTSTIIEILKRKDVKEHVEQLLELLDQARIDKLKGWFEEVIDDRISEVDSAGESTRKDTLEVVKAYADLLTSEKKSRKPQEADNIYVSILNQVMS